MKNITKFVTLIALVLMSMTSFAQQIKIAYIDANALVAAMPETLEAQKQLQTKQADVEKEFANMQQQYQSMVEEFQSKESTYTDIVKNAKIKEIENLQQRIRQFAEIAQQELEKSNQEMMKPIVEKARKAIEEVAKANGFTYVIAKEALIYTAPNAQDLLPLVKTKLGIK